MPKDPLSARYPRDLPAWTALEEHVPVLRQHTLTELFASDGERFNRFSCTSGDLFLDYSKNLLTAETVELLASLASQCAVREAITDMFDGAKINTTESRAVLHVALRAKPKDNVGQRVGNVEEVSTELDRMTAFVRQVHGGDISGHRGETLTDVVNIGIGGSDLGPVMAANALRQFWRPGVRFHSVSNVDGTQLADLRQELHPGRTLFVICSKTFTTQETMTNAHHARAWIVERLGEGAVSQHFAAASTNHEAMDAFGIDVARRFGFWDWVGGRYSLWSAVGLSLALVVGDDNFRRLLDGGRTMDRHFREAPVTENLPVLLALISIWHNNFLGAESHAILPYDNRLDRFPAYLQQLQMESSGKRVRRDGQPATVNTGQVIWGESGSNAQHSFYQLLHQGTRFIPVDFILPIESSGASQAQQDLAIANCLAQSEALMAGHMTEDPHRQHVGNRPSSTILFDRLTPEVLGQLIALYEHKVFVENSVWGTNAFDQFGVELGKKLARGLEGAVSGAAMPASASPSTRGLLDRVSQTKAK